MNIGSILITGGAGFIGSEFVRQSVASKKYSKIFIIDKLTYAADLNRIRKELDTASVEFIECDLNDTARYQSIIPEISYIVHFAAESHVDRSNENGKPFLESNILGTYSLLESARQNTGIRTLLVSTDEVYGSTSSGEFSETSPLNPSSAYSASKTSSDLFGLAAKRTFNQDVVVSRGCNTYGPHQHPEKFIPLCISKLISGLKAPLYGDGSNIREWMHVTDHAEAIDHVMHYGESGEIYNIGSGFRLSNREVLDYILRNLDLNWEQVDFVEDRLGHDFRYALNSEKLQKKISWQAKVDFESGLASTVKWYREELNVK